MAEIDKVIAKHGGFPGAFAAAPVTTPATEPAPTPIPKSQQPDLGIQTEDELPLG